MDDKCCRCGVLAPLPPYIERRRDGVICPRCIHKEMIYLATPYTHASAEIREIRFKQAAMLGGKLIDEGHRIFSLIVAYHPMSWYGNFKTDWETFKLFCKIYMSISTILYIAEFSGWEKSIGIEKERLVAKEYGLPVFHLKIPNALIEESTNG